MNEAIKLSSEGMRLGHGGPFGCVVVKDNIIVGKGWNSVLLTKDPTAHAEIMAIRDACNHLSTYQLTGCTLYCSSEPCPMCMGAIYWARPDRVVFANSRTDSAAIGFDDSFIYEQLDLPYDQRKIKTEQMPSQSALDVFRQWRELKNKQLY